jgi:hypothetical protein
VVAPSSGPNADEPAESKAPGRYEFRVAGDVWHLRFGDEEWHYESTKGLSYLHALLSKSDRLISAAELLGDGKGVGRVTHSHQALIEKDTLRKYYDDLADYDRQIDRARADGDEGLAEELAREKANVLEHVREAMSHLGKGRKGLGPLGPAARAADAIRQALARAFAKLQPRMPKLQQHLKTRVQQTGTSFVYSSDNPPIPWKL